MTMSETIHGDCRRCQLRKTNCDYSISFILLWFSQSSRSRCGRMCETQNIIYTYTHWSDTWMTWCNFFCTIRRMVHPSHSDERIDHINHSENLWTFLVRSCFTFVRNCLFFIWVRGISFVPTQRGSFSKLCRIKCRANTGAWVCVWGRARCTGCMAWVRHAHKHLAFTFCVLVFGPEIVVRLGSKYLPELNGTHRIASSGIISYQCFGHWFGGSKTTFLLQIDMVWG